MPHSSYPKEAVTAFKDMGILLDFLEVSVTLIGDAKRREPVERLASQLSEPSDGVRRVSGAIFSVLRPALFETLGNTCLLLENGDSTALGAAYLSYAQKMKAMARGNSRRMGALMGTDNANLASIIKASSHLDATMPDSYQALSEDEKAAIKLGKSKDMTALSLQLTALRETSERLAQEVGGYEGNRYRERWQSEAAAAEFILKDWLAKGGAQSEADIARHCAERTRAEM